MKFDAFINDINVNKWNVFGVEIYKDGSLIHSYGDTQEHIFDIYSATKSIVSIALGIVYDRGLIDIQKSILAYLPKNRIDHLSFSQRDAFEKISIYRLLTMSVGGFPFRPEGDDYLDFALNCSIEHPEQAVFHYSNIDCYLICVALTEIIGCNLIDFLNKEVFSLLDIKDYDYELSPEGYFYGASKMKLSVHDLSKFGLLMCNGGVYNGHRIVSEEYVRLATSVQQNNQEGGYGFFFWKYRDGFSISGKWKQKCYCLPKDRVVISFLSHIEEDVPGLLRSMETNILELDD